MPKPEINQDSSSKNDLVRRLLQHPELHERVEELLRIVENADGDACTADETEEQIADQLRRLGQEAMQSWADRKLEKVENRYEESRSYKRREKKTLLVDSVRDRQSD
jgi:hypothetical protein